MGRDLNELTLIGRLVKDPEIKYTANGTAVTKFSIANNNSFTQNNETKEYVNYFDVNVWGNQAVSCEKYLKKGSQVAITGNLKQNRWQDQATGQTRSKVEITANSVQFLSPAQNQGNSQGQPNNNQPQQPQGDQQNQPSNNNTNFDPYKQPEVIQDPFGQPSQQQQDAQGGYPQNNGNQQNQQQDNNNQQPSNNNDDIPF